MADLTFSKDKEVFESIKRIVLERYPVIENRMEIFTSKSEFEIDICFYKISDDKSHTQIRFLDGTESYRTSISEDLNVDYRLSPNFIIYLIMYILESHEAVMRLDKTSINIQLTFGINWCERNLQGISCRSVTLNIDFYGCQNKDELISTYFKTILTTFFDKLKDTPLIQREMSKYVKKIMTSFATNASDEEIRSLFEKMSTTELRNIVYDFGINNASIFFDALNEIKNDEEKTKRLELQ